MLTPAQQATLDYHLRETNLLTNEELILELTDHYTIVLAERMAEGMTFEASLIDIQRAFGGRKGLQKMEREYNSVTLRHYDTRFMNYVQRQRQWPHLLAPLFVFIVVYWTTTHLPRPAYFSTSMLTNNRLSGLALGSTIGLIIQFFRIWFLQGNFKSNIPSKAIYIASRFLPINFMLYGSTIALVNWADVFPPYVYEATLSSVASIGVAYMLSYSSFYQSTLKSSKN